MKKLIRTSAVLLIFSAIVFAGCKNNQKSNVRKSDTRETTQPSDDQTLKKGEYIVTISGCNDCHSPKENGPQGPVIIEGTRLSGYPAYRTIMKADPEITKAGWILFNPDLTSAVGPWGVSFAANLTSDQTGIGNWIIDNFKRALREGKFKGLENGRMLLPPMPWQELSKMTDEDMTAVFVYLKSTPPVSNIVPAPISPEVTAPDNQVVK